LSGHSGFDSYRFGKIKMKVAIILFCFFMTLLTAIKCWIKDERGKVFRLIATIITIGSGITGYIVLYKMLPTPASPQINELFFYADGNQKDFTFCCEFLVRNDGATFCTLEKVEFVLQDVKFKSAKSALVTVGLGGGGGGRYGGGTASIKNEVACSYFPQSLSSMNQVFRIIGHGNSSALSAERFSEIDTDITVKFHFRSNNKPFVLERTIPIIYRHIDNMRF
jgi:hypothetical protein